MDGVALPGDRTAKGYFERHGMTARLLVMHRRLPTAAEAAAVSAAEVAAGEVAAGGVAAGGE